MLKGLASSGICTTPMCDAGAASVAQMQTVFNQLDSAGQVQFLSSATAINDSFNSIYSWYSDMIPFNPDCCAVQDLGAQADALTHQMQQYMSVPAGSQLGPGPGTSAAGMSLPALIVLGVLGFLALSHVANKI